MRPTRLRGARTHNLAGVDLDLEPGALVAIAGPSGAGKSSLAFGTLYAEGQRRYVESFSAYARQFLERLARPPVDALDPVPAAIAVDRASPVRTSRSTVGTMTEVADYAKTLWARAATLQCPGCGRPVGRDAPTGAAAEVLQGARDQRIVVTYPVRVGEPEEVVGLREELLSDGYRRVLVEGEQRELDTLRPSDVFGEGRVAEATRRRGGGLREAAGRAAGRGAPKVVGAKRAARSRARTAAEGARATPGSPPSPQSDAARVLHVVVDRTVAAEAERQRIAEAIEAAMRRGLGRADVVVPGAGTFRFSSGLHCAHCDLAFRDPTPGTFSFNSPVGACATCRGFGRTIGLDLERVIPDPSRSLAGGAVKPWAGKKATWERRELRRHAQRVGVPMDVPVAALTPEQRRWLVEGEGLGWKKGWWGVRAWFEWLETKAYKMHVRVLLSRYRKYETCEACGGGRLEKEALAWRLAGHTLPSFFALPVSEALVVVEAHAPLVAHDPAVALLLREVGARLSMLRDVGLGYLTLDRASRTLSGGETQRVALTGALGASLAGAMFVLDEPTVGLHPRDVQRLFGVVRGLCGGDNIAIVVEHDPEVLRGADRVIELGPGAGEHGGRVVFDGTPAALARAETATGRALSRGPVAGRTRREGRGALLLRGASGHNLRGVELRIPRAALTCVTGVSGSGKSSLALETLYPAVARKLGQSADPPLPHASVEGHEALAGALRVDQAPLGRTSRGNPATYLKAWDAVRKRFVAEPLARSRGYGPGTFSFNVPGGRCEACKGEGAETVEMQFLADVTFSCPECGGRRFAGPVLDVLHRGLSIADVLDLTATEAIGRFGGDAELERRLAPLLSVGLGYLRLGQPLNTLSGGEAQRLKLAEALARALPGSLVVLDEPTAGLHADDVAPLLDALDLLVERGDTVVVVEHDPLVMARSDWIVDLGPGAGARGGAIVAEGTPEDVARATGSVTAPFLAHALGLGPRPDPAPVAAPPSRRRPAGGPEPIRVTGATEHNLKDVSVEIPRERLVVVTGPSGSGKSTLAFDIVHAEGQRRYLETLSAYARQYLPQLPRPAVDRVTGVPPSVSLEQRTTRGGVNSTVATITEVAHYLRLLWARAGLLRCPACDLAIAPRTAAAIAADLRARLGARAQVRVLFPLIRGRKGLHREALARARKDGFAEALIDGALRTLERGLALDRYKEHDVDVSVGALAAGDGELERVLQIALERGDGIARVLGGDESLLVSSRRACPSCGRGFPELDPRVFSFNTRQGACEPCEGRGVIVRTRGRGKHAREVELPCEACAGTRLSPLARAVRVGGRALPDVTRLAVAEARVELERLALDGRQAEVARVPLAEAGRRLAFLEQVGLGYLGLDRPAGTLSGGEMQRVRLAAQLGAGLTGVLYVLDEPTIGLHPRDTSKLLCALRALVDAGSSVLVVEHDADTIAAADHVIDVGPGGGRTGGRVVAQGSPARLAKDPASVTGPALARAAPVPTRRRPIAGARRLVLRGASQHNLRGVDLEVPLGRLVAVTGVSGSGKSTLVREVLLRATRAALGLVAEPPGAFASISGHEALRRCVEIDQSPIGRTPRSVPATYIGIWDELRKLLAGTPEARARGYTASRFSFNVKGGRCPACEGQGALQVEMSFLPEVHVPCEACGGRRFAPETLDVLLHGLDAGAILDLDVADAVGVLAAVPKVARPLRLLSELGLGYLRLGQPSNTLSGGEAQRLKLVSELAATGAGPTLYVMDEPTTGLHRDDVARLVGVLGALVDRGDTVLVIEHHPDVIVAADHVVDLGPEGGAAGGRIVVEGTPEAVAAFRGSHTGAVLRAVLGARPGGAVGARA